MSSAVLLFLARILLLLLLYLFLFLVVQALRQDLRAAARRAAASSPPPVPDAVAAGLPAAPMPPASAPQAPLQLELVDAGQTPLPPGQRFPLRDPLVIGRAPRSDIALEDDWISARHLRLRHANGDWLAEDLGSTNGTRVNGHPLTGAVRIHPGDVLDLGRVKFRLVERS